jgi:predicted MFS family arabinose efflux permease
MMACFGLLPGLAFANMPRVARSPEQTTLGFSAIALFGNLGTFLGTPLLALFLSAGGWEAVALVLAAISVVGAGLGWALDRATRKDVVVN